jgi:hypothetical protein
MRGGRKGEGGGRGKGEGRGGRKGKRKETAYLNVFHLICIGLIR